jgi:hypothetical protein
MPTVQVDAGSCGAVVTAVASGVLLSDVVNLSQSGAPTPGPALKIRRWPTANNVDFPYCNETTADLKPLVATLNWQMLR